MPCDRFTAVMLAELIATIAAGALIPGIGIGIAFAGCTAFIVIVAGMIVIELNEPAREIDSQGEAGEMAAAPKVEATTPT